jgi:hypothetical protein
MINCEYAGGVVLCPPPPPPPKKTWGPFYPLTAGSASGSSTCSSGMGNSTDLCTYVPTSADVDEGLIVRQ